MKNKFNIDVAFNTVPLKPFEWDKTSFLSGIRVYRVSTKCLLDLTTYDGMITGYKNYLLISDAKNAIVLKINKEGAITKRSFLNFNDELEVCEFASHLNITNIEYKIFNRKIRYSLSLSCENKIKEYVLKKVEETNDIDKSRYLYFLYFNQITDYSKEKLINSIKADKVGKYQKIYDFLVKN